MKTVTRDPTASDRQRRMRERRSRGFSTVGVEVCRRDVKMLAKRGFLDGDPAQAEKVQIAYAIGQLLDHFISLDKPTPG